MIKKSNAFLFLTLCAFFALGMSADRLWETKSDWASPQVRSYQSRLDNENKASQKIEQDAEILSSIPYANEMLTRLYGTNKPFPRMPAADIAKRFNHLVFNFCSSTPPHTGVRDINELFSLCQTACGGYSYVLRGLLATQGIKTRYSNFCNLPQQGNHTAVEVEIDPGKWALFDPTFGTFFTSDGNVEGEPLSTEDVRFIFNSKTIHASVLMANKNSQKIQMPLKNLYEQNFHAQYMNLENYVSAEQAASVGSKAVVPLVMMINVENGEALAGSTSFGDMEDGSSSFLKWTNETLRNQSDFDDTSYLFHVVGQYGKYFQSMNILKIVGLKPDDLYKIQIHGYAPNASEIQVVPIGKAAKLNIIEPQTLEVGRFLVSRLIKSKDSEIDILISNRSDNEFKIYAISVKHDN